MTVLNDCVCQHVGYCDGSCQHPEPASSSTSAGVTEETAWLIELRGNTPSWWSVSGDEPDWTHDNHQALRFARKSDAEAYIESTGWTEAIATEHMWIGPRSEATRVSAGVTEEQTPRVTEAMVARATTSLFNCVGDPLAKRNVRAALEASRSPVSQKEAVPVAYQHLVDGKWVECSEFVAKGWGDELSPDTRALYASPVPAPAGEPAIKEDYFGGLVEKARAAAAKASVKFPQPNYVTLKIAEEAGEVVRGAVHYAEGRMEWSEVEGEIVQLLAMLIRFVTEGDQINGVTPPALHPSPTPVSAPAGEPVGGGK